jgi:hypothetical protein
MRRVMGFLLPAVGVMTLAQPLAQTDRPGPDRRPASAITRQPGLSKVGLMAGAAPALFKGLRYRLVGPSRGGRVTAVTGVPSQPKTFYMGVASGGLFRTTDAGVTWTPITDGKVPLGSVGAIAVADSDPKIIYLGTGSDGVRSNVSTGRGVYKSTDGGDTWAFVGLYHAGQIGAVRIHPTEIAWVAANGDIFKPNDERGVFKTSDGGKTWRKTLFVSDAVGAMDVELQPGAPDVVYAWMSRLERKPWTIISGSREGGFYKSTDGGDRFSKISTGLPAELIGKANLAVTAAKPDRVYALIEALPGGGFYRTHSRRSCSGRFTTRRSAPIRRTRTWSTLAPKGSSSRPMPAVRSRRYARRMATTMTSGSIRRTATSWCRRTTAAPMCRSTAGAHGPRR